MGKIIKLTEDQIKKVISSTIEEQSSEKGKLHFLIGKPINLIKRFHTTKYNPEKRGNDDVKIDNEVSGEIVEFNTEEGVPMIKVQGDKTTCFIMYDNLRNRFIEGMSSFSYEYLPKTEKDQRILDLFKVNFYGNDNSGEELNEESTEDGSYMVLQNLYRTKVNIEKIMSYRNHPDFDKLVTGEHAWAGDHIATSKDDIEEVAGFIESFYEKKESMNEAKKMKNPCWKGYRAYGTKTKNGKEVPNCVPIDKSKINIGLINNGK